MQATDYPFGPVERLDLDPTYAKLRAEQPLVRVRMPYGGEAWLALRHEDVRIVLADPRFSRAAAVGQDVPRVGSRFENDPTILGMDPPEHSRLRRLVAKAFTTRQVEMLRPRVQEIIDDLIDSMIEHGSPADLGESLAWPLPITVISELLGVPYDDRDQFRAWTDQVLSIGGDDPEGTEDAWASLTGYLAGLVAQRRERHYDDLLGELVRARDEGDRLTEQELVVFGASLLVAGHETTADMIGNFVYTLLRDHRLWEALVAEPGMIGSAVEELLRFIPLAATSSFARIATEDLELGGELVRAGDAVLVNVASANRDENVFANPEELDFTRQDNPHLAFGHGVHHCLGAPLARQELRLAMETLVRRLPELRLAVPADRVQWRQNRIVRGTVALPVAW